jgi:heptosyltransferase-2
MEYDIDTVMALGADVIDRSIKFYLPEIAVNKVSALLEEKGISKDTMLIGIHPGGMQSRRWPVENFNSLIIELSKHLKCEFVITAKQDESHIADILCRNLGAKVVSTAGKLSIKEMAAVIKRCSLFISNDTGPMHIAAILGVPLVAIFGPGQLECFDPRKISDKAHVLYKKVDCAPCNDPVCRSMKCLKIITPQEVIDACFSLINR